MLFFPLFFAFLYRKLCLTGCAVRIHRGPCTLFAILYTRTMLPDRQLSCSDIEPLKLADLLGRASADALDAWDALSLAYPNDSRGDESLRWQIASYYNATGAGAGGGNAPEGGPAELGITSQPDVSPDDVTVAVPAEGILLAMLAMVEEG